MQTKELYSEGIWEKIESHPDYDLGKRELKALIRFISAIQPHLRGKLNVLHLGVATGREIPHLIKAIPRINNYILVDICCPVLQKTFMRLKSAFPHINFHATTADIEKPKEITYIKKDVLGKTLFVLVGNCSIFSNHALDSMILGAMKRDDLFLITSETPHPHMYQSYQIEPVYKFLSKGGPMATSRNTRISYNTTTSCLDITCQGTLLLSSYKPTMEHLRQRMNNAGFREVALKEYFGLCMISSLWRRPPANSSPYSRNKITQQQKGIRLK